MDWRGFISFAVLSAGLVGAVSYFGRPNANTERPDGAGTLVSNEPSRESLPRGEGGAAKAFRTFAPQGTWFDAVSTRAVDEPPGTREALSGYSTPWQTVITVEAGGDWPTHVNIAKPGGIVNLRRLCSWSSNACTVMMGLSMGNGFFNQSGR